MRLLNKDIEWRVESVCFGLWWTMNNEKRELKWLHMFIHCIALCLCQCFWKWNEKIPKSWRSGKKLKKERFLFCLLIAERMKRQADEWPKKKHILWDKRNEFSLQRVSAFDLISEGKEEEHLCQLYFWGIGRRVPIGFGKSFFFSLFQRDAWMSLASISSYLNRGREGKSLSEHWNWLLLSIER